MRGTILVLVVGVLFFLLQMLHFLSVVLGIRIAEERSVCRLSEPVWTSPKLIRKICVVVDFRLLVWVVLGVGALASQGEVSSCVFICGLDVLIVSFVPWELWWVGTEVGGRSITVKKVLGVRPIQLVSQVSPKGFLIYGVDVEMRTFQTIVFLIVLNHIGDGFL